MQKIPEEAEIRKHYAEVTRMLIDKKLTISTMESMTAGQIASLLTDTEGSSAVLKGAFVTYSNEAKIQQGVPAEIIERYSVYSRETAAAMAEACRKAYAADLGIGVTGTTGNVDPANPEASVPGCVYYAVSSRAGIRSYAVKLPHYTERFYYKLAAAAEIYEALLCALK
ncbi:MAG: CinA family protein [Lachnospiraceae bacterium]|nr:CinA family protein [Lachnospiraceae bacterium]